MSELSDQIRATSIRRMDESKERIDKCVQMLSKEQLWGRFNNNTPRVGDLVLHLSGNIQQWILSTFSDLPDNRERDEEFSSSGILDKEELIGSFDSIIENAIESVKVLQEEQLIKDYEVQGFQETGTDILVHVVEHLSYHTGQIALHTKTLLNKDLGFYAGQDLNSKKPTIQ